jgi:MFS family permease
MSIAGFPDTITVARSRFAERLIVPAGFITTAGNAFQITAAAIMVFRADRTTLSVGWLFIAMSVPQAALSVLFGRMADKVDRRLLCVLSDLVSAVTAVALPVWLWLGGATSLGSYLANFLLACTAALFMPASNALIKERIRDDRLGRFNSRYEAATNAGMLLASSTAGFLVVAFGTTPLFVFNSGTFVASAGLTYLIGRRPAVVPVATADQPAESAPTRVRLPIRRLALLYTNGNIGLMVANTILTALILRTFHQGPWLIGVVDALAGAGFIAGATCYGWVSARIGGLPLAVLGMLGNLVVLVVEPLHYIVLMTTIPLAGFCFAQGRIAARTLLMRAAPADRVGRVFGAAQALGLGLGIAATVGLSALADSTTVPYAFWGCAILQGAIVMGTYLSLAKPFAARKKPAEILEVTAV